MYSIIISVLFWIFVGLFCDMKVSVIREKKEEEIFVPTWIIIAIGPFMFFYLCLMKVWELFTEDWDEYVE